MKKLLTIIALCAMLFAPTEAYASDSYTDSVCYTTCVADVTDEWKICFADSSYGYGYELTMLDDLDGNIYYVTIKETGDIYEAVRHSLHNGNRVIVTFSYETDNPELYNIEKIDIIGRWDWNTHHKPYKAYGEITHTYF